MNQDGRLNLFHHPKNGIIIMLVEGHKKGGKNPEPLLALEENGWFGHIVTCAAYLKTGAVYNNQIGRIHWIGSASQPPRPSLQGP